MRIDIHEEARTARGRERAVALGIVAAFIVFGFTCYAGFSIAYYDFSGTAVPERSGDVLRGAPGIHGDGTRGPTYFNAVKAAREATR